MKHWILLALIGFGVWAYLGGWLKTEKWANTLSEPVPVYRWKDEHGRFTYGSQPPAGRKAERVRAEDRMSVLNPPQPKPASPAAMPAVQDLKEKMIERAVEGGR